MAKIKKAQKGTKASADSTNFYTKRMLSDMDMEFRSKGDTKNYYSKKVSQDVDDVNRQSKKGKPGYDKDGFPIKKQKSGGKVMLKRKDGSVSQKGLWDNIRNAAKRNKAAGRAGKKPTAQMLKQERKIKAKTSKKK